MRLRSILWAALAGLAVAAALHSGALVFATLAAALLAGLVVVTRRRVFRSFTFTRTPDRRVVGWGGHLEVTVSLTNAKLLPLVWLRLRDDWPLGLEPHGFALEPARWADCQRLHADAVVALVRAGAPALPRGLPAARRALVRAGHRSRPVTLSVSPA